MKSLYESLLDDFDGISANQKLDVRGEVYTYIRRNYLRTSSFSISRKPDADGLYEVKYKHKAPLTLKAESREATGVTNGFFKFVGPIPGFKCENCQQLKSLEGLPEEIDGDMLCWGAKSLESLEGCPKKINGNINLNDCVNLKSLKGMPTEGVKSIEMYNCWNLESLEGMPKEVNYLSISRAYKLKSLKGMPETIKFNLCITACEGLTNLNGMAKVVNGKVDLSWLKNLKSLKGMPKEVGLHKEYGNKLVISNCGITSLEGMPKKVHGTVRIVSCDKEFTEEEVKEYCDAPKYIVDSRFLF